MAKTEDTRLKQALSVVVRSQIKKGLRVEKVLLQLCPSTSFILLVTLVFSSLLPQHFFSAFTKRLGGI